MNEIEIKRRVTDLAALTQALDQLGITFGPAVTQVDQAYAPTGWTYEKDRVGVTFCRLRSQGSATTFTVKQPVDERKSCIEHETKVSDPAAMHEAILLMGYYPTVEITKTRRTAKHQDLVICLDEVAGLGTFMEVEYLAGPADDADRIYARLEHFAESLEAPLEPVHAGYDRLVRDAKSGTPTQIM